MAARMMPLSMDGGRGGAGFGWEEAAEVPLFGVMKYGVLSKRRAGSMGMESVGSGGE